EQLLILMSGVAPDEPGRDTWLEQVMRRREGGMDEQGNMSAPQPWLSVAELIQLRGVSREVIDRLMPHLTVDSVHLGVDFRYASRALLTLLLGESAAQGVIEEHAQSGDMPLRSGGPADMHTTITSGIYRIQVELAHAGRVRQLEATARFGESAAGYQLIRWNDYTARFALDGY
ncbi:MAG: general secretion pathway protein GspK, partial [Gammaproteobacteria bacterium]|nr:general secretion pathway protein GspK [Gammaproteobacteria bacterium]